MNSELTHVVDALPGLIWTALPDGRIDFLNQRWREYTGLSAAEACGQGWRAFIHPDDLPDFLDSWQSIRSSGQPGEMQARLRRSDGEYRWFAFSARPVVDDAGGLVKWCGITTDIEDQKHLDDSARLAERRFASIVDGLPTMITLRTPEGNLEFANRHYLDYFGSTFDELKVWGQSFHPKERADVLSTWRRSIATGKPWDIEARRRRADGIYRWFHTRGFPLREPDGRISLWYNLHEDIDERKRAEALLAGEKRVLEMVTDGRAMPAILEALCLVVEDMASDCYCSVVLVDSNGTRLEHGAAPSLPATFIKAIVGRTLNVDSGPCAMAAYLNQQIIASDIRSEDRWTASEWCPMALAHGIEACWSTPITSATGNVMGAFAIYYAKPRTPTSQDQAFIDQFTHIASIAIERERFQVSLKRALDELRISEGKLRTIIDAIPGFVWSATPDGNIDFLNERWCEYTGVSMTDACGSGWQNAIHPDDADVLPAYWRSLLESGNAGEFEARLRRFDGSFRWFLIRTVPLRDEDGNVVKWYGQNTDIQDRKQAEALLEGEKRLLEMVAGDCSLTAILEALCKLVEATSANCRCSILLTSARDTYLRYKAEMGVRLTHAASAGVPTSLMVGMDGHAVGIESYPCAMAATLNEQVIIADIEAETRWETWRRVALANGLRAAWTTPIAARNGKVLGTFLILYGEPKTPTPADRYLIEQFTHLASIAIERAQDAGALSRSQAFLLEAQRLSSTGSFSWRVGTDEITWSEQVYRIFGLDPEMLVTNEVIASRHHPEDLPVFQEMVERGRSGGDFEFDHRLLMPDGTVKYLHTVAHGARDQNGQLEYIGAIQDVTERRLSEEALGAVRKELARVSRITSLGALTASIAHEVNQPLSGIITNASTCLRMLAADPPNVDGARETARRTIRDGNRASDVITRLRALFTKKTVSTEPVDLNEATCEVIALSRRELQNNRIVLRLELSDDLPRATGDRVQLQQVILNLLLNASDAMSSVNDRPRRLVVKTEQGKDDYLVLSVRDVGVGFGSFDFDKLFEAFYTTKESGMGIGLSVSRSIIEHHQGRLWAATNDGPGATFSFSIPQRIEDATGTHRPITIRKSAVQEAQHATGNT
jgi:PAS domain S-box-containing protein